MNAVGSIYTAKELEEAFEWYYNEILSPIVSSYERRPSRYCKPGRVYGIDGTYRDQAKENQYQIWVNDARLVERTVEEYYSLKDSYGEPEKDYFYDNLLGSDAAYGAAIGAEVAKPGEPMEDEEDIYPNDLLDPEPFIRAPVVSHEGAMVIEEMRREDEWTGAFSNAFVDPAWSLTEWEESDWVRNHPDPMISRIYVQATDRRYNRSKR